MQINNLEKNNNLNIDNKIVNEKEQKQFLETTLGKTINFGIDMGIRALLPDFLEEQVIEIKDNLFNYGFKEGIKRTIDDAIETGKSMAGIFTGNFENINQMHEVVKTGGILDGVSNLLDFMVDKAEKSGVIDSNISNLLLNGKDIILTNVENNIEKTFNDQIKSMEYTRKYINNWKEFYKNKNFEGMEKEYEKLKTELKNLAPIEETLNTAREIEILHNLIKNNEQKFNLTNEQIELAKKLSIN